MRRKQSVKSGGGTEVTKNWIDESYSADNGKTWKFLSKVADTDKGLHNGNPPSLVRLKDGRLCAAYGYRAVPYGIRARISNDNGKTWGKEILLRTDGRTWDLGYTRMVVRPDGKVVTLYYFTTEKNKEEHIAATIWDPGSIK
jgi:Neuraminidase (sialidase)